MPPAGFETKIPASEWPWTHVLDLNATENGDCYDGLSKLQCGHSSWYRRYWTAHVSWSMLWALRQPVSALKVVESCKMLQGFVQNLVKMLQGFVQNLVKMLQGFVQNLVKMLQGFVQNLDKMLQGFVQNLVKILQGFVKNLVKMLQGFVQNLVYSPTWNWRLIVCGTNWCVRNPPEGVSVTRSTSYSDICRFPWDFSHKRIPVVLKSLSRNPVHFSEFWNASEQPSQIFNHRDTRVSQPSPAASTLLLNLPRDWARTAAGKWVWVEYG